MDAPQPKIPVAKDMGREVLTKGRDWMNGPEAELLLNEIRSSSQARATLVEYFSHWRNPPMSFEDIVEYFILDYLHVGTGDGNALRQDPASAIVRHYVGDHEINGDDRIIHARLIHDHCPEAYWFMVALAKKHSSLCQEVLRSRFKSHVLYLQRGVTDSNKHFALESWAYAGSVKGYGEITLCAKVPLASVLSLRTQEHEIIVLRNTWESQIVVDNQTPSSIQRRPHVAGRWHALLKRLQG